MGHRLWGIFSFLLVLILGSLIVTKLLGQPFCANSLSCKDSFNLKVENNQAGVFAGQKMAAPSIDLAEKKSVTQVLGEETATGEKHIYINLETQTLTAYQANTEYMQVPISSGKWHPTPIGEFSIWEKVRATRMTGGTGADYYDLPNVPYVMFFSGPGAPASAGFGLHGAYWHDNFGHPMSHGCINMRTVDVQKLYDWVGANDPKTAITIYGQAPL
jgi:lipoprotein-anchoring transpeptidase ErfK/SrfK